MGNKKISVFTGVAACVGLVLGSNVFLSVGQGTAIAGTWFWVALIPVAIIYLAEALSLSELHMVMPKAGGVVSTYMGSLFGPAVSLSINLMVYFVTAVLLGVMEVLLCSKIVCQMFCPGVPPIIISTMIISFLAIVNLLGTDMFSKVQDIVFVVMVVTLIILATAGCLKLAPASVPVQIDTTPASGWNSIMSIMGLAAFLFLGIDMVLPLAKDMKHPNKDIRHTFFIGIGLLFVLYSLLSIGLKNYLPLDTLMQDETPNITYAKQTFGNIGYYWMGIATVFAAISTTNTAFQSGSRVLAGTSSEGMLPAFLNKVNKKGAPSFSLLIFWVASMVIAFICAELPLVTIMAIGTAFYMVVYLAVHVMTLILRHRYPDAKRERKYIMFHIPQVIGMIGTCYLMYLLCSDRVVLIVTIITFIVLFVFSCVWCKFAVNIHPFHAIVTDDIRDLEMGKQNRNNEGKQSSTLVSGQSI